MKENGGLITEQDLLEYRSIWRDPIKGTYRGKTIVTMPPPSSGGVHLIQMLNILENFELSAYEHNSYYAHKHLIQNFLECLTFVLGVHHQRREEAL